MTPALIISSLLSWAMTLMLILAVWALARQVGLLHERIQPVGALALGKALQAGAAAPLFTLPSLTGGSISLGGVNGQGRATLLCFLSETCPVCKTLLPVLDSLRRQERARMQVVLASDGEAPEHLAFIAAQSLQAFPYVLSRELGLAFQISKLPYAVLIDERGTVASHGLVNTREHLESLLEARRLGHATVQAYHAAQQGL